MSKKELHNIKTSGFNIPKDYFSQVEEQLLSEVNLRSKIDNSGFKAPNTYFETLDQNILDAIATEQDTKVVKLFPWKKIIYVSTIAASIILMYNILMKPTEGLSFETIEIASIENYIEHEELSSYELASLLNEDELNTNNFIENTIPESSIEDYLLENVDLEDLIIEQ